MSDNIRDGLMTMQITGIEARKRERTVHLRLEPDTGTVAVSVGDGEMLLTAHINEAALVEALHALGIWVILREQLAERGIA